MNWQTCTKNLLSIKWRLINLTGHIIFFAIKEEKIKSFDRKPYAVNVASRATASFRDYHDIHDTEAC